MAFTKGDIRGLVKQFCLTYRAQTKLDDRTIDLNIQRATMDIFAASVNSREWLFRKTASLADAANLPSDFYEFANHAVDGSGTPVPASYITPGEIGMRKTNTWDLATATSVSYYTTDQTIKILPAASSPLTVSYYFKPTNLADPTVLDSVASSIPDELKWLLMMGAARWCYQMLYDQAEAFRLTQQEREMSKSSLDMYSKMYNLLQTKEAKDN